MVNWSEIKDSLETALNMVQGNPVLDTFARGALESIPVAGSILIKFYDKYSDTNPEDATVDLTETLKTMNQMNEKLFKEFCKRLQNNTDEILENRTFLKKLVTDTSKILTKLDDTNTKLDNVDEKLIRIEQRLIDLYSEGEKQLTAKKITDTMFQKIEERDQQISTLKKQLEDLGHNPSFNADYHFKQAQAYYYARKYEKSIEIADNILLEKPEHVLTLNIKGLSLSELGKLDSAKQYFEKALKLKPDDFMIAYNMGIALHESKNHELAVEYLKKALKIRPMRNGYLILFESLYALERYGEAMNYMKKILEWHPKDEEILQLLRKAEEMSKKKN